MGESIGNLELKWKMENLNRKIRNSIHLKFNNSVERVNYQFDSKLHSELRMEFNNPIYNQINWELHSKLNNQIQMEHGKS
jgi:hypothetical protein